MFFLHPPKSYPTSIDADISAARAAYYAFRATTPGTTAEEETYLKWVELGDKLSRLDRAIIRAGYREDARRQGE